MRFDNRAYSLTHWIDKFSDYNLIVPFPLIDICSISFILYWHIITTYTITWCNNIRTNSLTLFPSRDEASDLSLHISVLCDYSESISTVHQDILWKPRPSIKIFQVSKDNYAREVTCRCSNQQPWLSPSVCTYMPDMWVKLSRSFQNSPATSEYPQVTSVADNGAKELFSQTVHISDPENH